MKTKRLLFPAALAALFLLLPSAKVKADPFVFITTRDVSAPAGTSVDVFGVIINGGKNTIRVGNASASMEGDVFGFDINIDPFYQNPGIDPDLKAFVLGPGEDTGEIKLFTVTIDRFAFQGFPFLGFFFVMDSRNVLSNLDFFFVTATAPVPEPATMVLLGTGLAGGFAALRRRRKKMADA